MNFLFAPLEGLTDHIYRSIHHKYFKGMDKYYTPFLSPTSTHCFSKKEIQEILPENNIGFSLVPQLLTKNADDFLWAAEEIKNLGYREINLNLGCPSKTVIAKKKGSGLLMVPEELEQFLSAIFEKCELSISIKTRLGLSSTSEFETLLSIYQKFPIHELIVHPRTSKEMYSSEIHINTFQDALLSLSCPVGYNGNLQTVQDIVQIQNQFPSINSIMIGRGLIRNPALIRSFQEDIPLSKKELSAFHEELCETYAEHFGGYANALPRMKEIWFYMATIFQNYQKEAKKIARTSQWIDFKMASNTLLRYHEFDINPSSPKNLSRKD